MTRSAFPTPGANEAPRSLDAILAVSLDQLMSEQWFETQLGSCDISVTLNGISYTWYIVSVSTQSWYVYNMLSFRLFCFRNKDDNVEKLEIDHSHSKKRHKQFHNFAVYCMQQRTDDRNNVCLLISLFTEIPSVNDMTWATYSTALVLTTAESKSESSFGFMTIITPFLLTEDTSIDRIY